MSNYTVINHDWEQTVNGFDQRSAADDKRKAALSGFDISPDDLEVVKGNFEDYAEYQNNHESDDVDPEIIDHTEEETTAESQGDPGTPAAKQAAPEPPAQDLQAVDNKDISDDPLSVMPGHFVDTIQGTPTINRKGYAVLAEHYGISVVATAVTLPGETDHTYAEFRALATTEDGQEYSGFGSAHVDRQDGDDPHLLAELAETRAMKRAVAWATGVGMTAQEEMEGSL
ncbi:hypothetical protein OSG_eHP34_00210 [environmental Halophage eHP-34]|nr:hypothetical protein OSG_eHP34_00210 [environmental Halophage eHP-34]